MHHYPHYIKTFNNATRHLTRVERSLYRDLLDVYYDAEQPLPAGDFEALARRVMARSKDEKAALQVVLDEFFPVAEGMHRNARCDEEIQKYQSLRAGAVKAGKASAEARANRKATDVERPLPKRSTNQNQNHTSAKADVGAASGSPPAVRGTRLPKTWTVSASGMAFIAKERPDLDCAKVEEMFRDHWTAVPGKDGLKLDWEATWRKWVRNQRQLPGSIPGGVRNWWDGKPGITAKGLELVIPGPADSSDAAWFDFMAAVWLAAGDGPWLDEKSRAYPIYKRLRDGTPTLAVVASAAKKETAHAA